MCTGFLPSRQHRRVPRTFMTRNRRMTPHQEQAYAEVWSDYGLTVSNNLICFQSIFKREALRFCEIGFGSGQSLLSLAEANPQNDYIGIETYKSGIGALLLGIKLRKLTNIRVYCADALHVFDKCIPPLSIDGVQLFFPDPWPKRRHHRRRLIQSPFVQVMAEKIKLNGSLHLATDWQDYAYHMLKICSQEKFLINCAAESQFSERSPFRPVVTKFENRALRAGRKIYELQFCKIDLT